MGSTNRAEARQKRRRRVRKRVRGTPEKPRLSVFRSAKHIYAQIVDDTSGRTLIALVAKRASAKGVKRVVFDRNGFLYHGRIKALADSAREHGLEF